MQGPQLEIFFYKNLSAVEFAGLESVFFDITFRKQIVYAPFGTMAYFEELLIRLGFSLLTRLCYF